jgi:hydroxyethylthiazole kinase
MENVRKKHPLVHNITNYVTVNDCANILLAANASPIMSDDIAEVAEITSICNALVINIGTLCERTIASMVEAGKKSFEIGNPIVLDPVGAGASKLRTETAKQLLASFNSSVIRGNISELKALFTGSSGTKGVDANALETITEDNLDEGIKMAKEMSKKFDAIIAITGAIDIVTDGEVAYVIRNGHEKMRQITGTGCMLTSLIGAFVAANQKQMLESVVSAVCLMGLSGEKAWESCVKDALGTGSMKSRLIDFIGTLTADDCIKGFKGERV